jgi:hypothetical protein
MIRKDTCSPLCGTNVRMRTGNIGNKHRLLEHSIVLFKYASFVSLEPGDEKYNSIVSH